MVRPNVLAVMAAVSAVASLAMLSAMVVTSPRAFLLSAVPLLNGAPHMVGTGLNYMSGPISAGPAAAHMDVGEPDVGAYLHDVAERGRDVGISIQSPSSDNSAPYHAGVNRWREQRGASYPTYWGTSVQVTILCGVMRMHC